MEKKLNDELAAIQADYPTACVEVWAQDEARLGLKSTTRRIWTRRGARAKAPSDHRYEWLYLYGFVQPKTGESEWLLLPTVSLAAMSVALAEFATAIEAGPAKRVVLVVDQAGWHTSKKLQLPEGIHLLHLPSHTPELQPAERLWPLVREALVNRALPDLDTLEQVVVERCAQLSHQPHLLRSHTLFHWWPYQ